MCDYSTPGILKIVGAAKHTPNAKQVVMLLNLSGLLVVVADKSAMRYRLGTS